MCALTQAPCLPVMPFWTQVHAGSLQVGGVSFGTTTADWMAAETTLKAGLRSVGRNLLRQGGEHLVESLARGKALVKSFKKLVQTLMGNGTVRRKAAKELVQGAAGGALHNQLNHIRAVSRLVYVPGGRLFGRPVLVRSESGRAAKKPPARNEHSVHYPENRCTCVI